MFELADRLVGIYKTDNCTKSVTLNPHLLEEAVAPPSQPNLTVIQPSPAKTVSRSVLASVKLCLTSDMSAQDQLAVLPVLRLPESTLSEMEPFKEPSLNFIFLYRYKNYMNKK